MTVPHDAPSQRGQPAQQGRPSLVTQLHENLLFRQLLPPVTEGRPIPLVVGVSGGADSVALLHALAALAAPCNLALHIAHVNHQLRLEADEEAAFVDALARQLDIPFHQQTLRPADLRRASGGIEAAARRARYAFFRLVAHQAAYNVAGAGPVPVVAVAHNADDQAETLLLHLLRGSGMRGLGGMRWKRSLRETGAKGGDAPERDVWLIRPLLNVRRAEIEAYLRANGLEWRQDASNQDPAYTRNYLRHTVMPLLTEVNQQVVDALTRTAEILGDETERLDALDRRLLADLLLEPSLADDVKPNGPSIDRVVLDLDRWLALSVAEQRGVLRAAIGLIAPGLADVGFEDIERVRHQALRNGAAGPHPIGGKLCWSTLAAGEGGPRRLSLHDISTLPVQPTGPHLGSDWKTLDIVAEGDGAKDHGARAEILVGQWRLCSRIVDCSQLPADWRTIPPWQAWIDVDRVGRLLLATSAEGMRVAPLGMAGRTKSLGDLFTDAKVNPALRSGWPLVIDGDSGVVIWVCGLRLAHDSRITARTARVLHLAWRSTAMPDGTQGEESFSMSTSLKPLVHWAIYKGYKVRYTHRSPSQITGVLTTETGEVDFEFDPEALCISLPNERITINQFGWDLSSDAQEAAN